MDANSEGPTDFSKPCFEVCLEIFKTECFLVRADSQHDAEVIAALRFWGEYANMKAIEMDFDTQYDVYLVAKAGEDRNGNPI